jgi:tetratricopeptide (TPR) repeat protein
MMICKKSLFRWLFVAAMTVMVPACASSDKTSKTAATKSKKSSKKGKKLGNKVARTVYNVDAIDAASTDIEKALATASQGNVPAAIVALQNIAKKNPKAFLAHYNLGILQERQHDDAAARAAYEAALNAEPNFSPALMQMVRMDIRSGNPSAGISKANQYITASPDAFEHNYAKLEAMIANKQYDDTIALIRTLLKQDEANAKLRYYLAMTEFEKKRYRLADFIVGESLEIDPEDYEALFLRARIHDALSEEDVALVPGIAATLDTVLELNPDHLEALWMRGVIYYEASNYQQAELFFRKILSLNSKTVGAYINLANTLKTLDRGPEAEKLLQKAQELDPKNGLVYFALGTLYLNTELIKLPGLKDMDRLKMAKINFETAQQNWTSKDDIALAKGYIRTTDDAIETLQAMLDAEALFGTPSDDEGFGDDEFSDDGFSDDGSFDDSGDSFKVDDAEDDSNAFKVD